MDMPDTQPRIEDTASSSTDIPSVEPCRRGTTEQYVSEQERTSESEIPGDFRFSKKVELESRHILDENWEDAYWASPYWYEWWNLTQDPEVTDWPYEEKIYEKKMYWQEK